MIRLLNIIGARPQIIKAAAISRAVRTQFAGQIEEHILHTGQHYDDNMSEVFFRELGIPEPALLPVRLLCWACLLFLSSRGMSS